MLKVTIFVISYLIGSGVSSLLSEDSNVVEQFPFGDTGIVLEVQKKHAHLFLAEYDFTIILKSGLKEIDSIVMADTGGWSRIDVLRVAAGRYAFRHYGRTVCVDLAKGSFDDYCDSQKEATRIGYFDFDSSRQWRYLPDLD